MADLTFNTTSGQTIDRELLVLFLNTGTAVSPVWSPVGSHVADSSEELDWSRESETDILGKVRTTMKKPVITQTFDPMPLDGGDAAALKLWNLAIKDQDYAALAAQDVMIVHRYAGTADTAMFAERYDGAAFEATGLGGEGGAHITMPVTVTLGGTRTIGTAAKSGNTYTFTVEGDDGE